MKSIVLFLLLVVLSVPVAFGQIKIGDNPQNIDAASVLELESRDRVLVITRVNTAEMEAIVPQRGGLVFNTDTNCISYYDGTEWINLCDAAGITFTNEHLANTSIGPSIVITQNGSTYNFEVAPNSIRSEQIVDGGINGVDIQDNSIGESKLGTDSVSSNELRDNSVGSSEVVDGSIRPEDLANTIPEQVLTTDENGIPRWENATNLTNEVALDIAENAMDIADHIINDNDTDDRNELTDISFDKITNVLSLTRSETAVGQTTDLSSLIGSDDQTLTLTPDNRLQIEDGNEIDLNIFNNPGSDNQTLSLDGNTLAITGGNDVSLAGFVNTDNQNILGGAIVGNQLRIDIEDGNSGTIDVSALTGTGTDNQNLEGASLSPLNVLQIDIEDGNSTTVDLSSLVDIADGTETILNEGTNITITGDGSAADPYVINAVGGATADGTETILNEGTNITITGDGSAADPYVINAVGGATADGTETILNEGTNITITGDGSAGDPYFINAVGGATADGSETIIDPSATVTVAGTGTTGDPYILTAAQADGSETIINSTASVTVTGNGTVGSPYELTSAATNPEAVNVSFTPAGNTASNQVQAAIEELQTEIDGISLGGVANPNDELITSFTLVGTELNIAEGGNIPAPIDLDPTFVTEAELAAAITASETADGDTSETNEIQPLTSTDGSVTVAANGIGFDISVPVGTDNQNIQGSVLNDETLTIGIQNGTAQDVDLSSLTTDLELAAAITASETADGDTSDTNEIQPLVSTDGSVTVAANGIGFDLSVPVGTDNQNIQGSVLNDETLTIGIQNGTAQDVDLSALTTDLELAAAITASETADGDTSDTNEIQPLTSTDGSVSVAANGIGFDLSVPVGTDSQNIQGSILNNETLTIGIQNGTAQDVDLSALTTDLELAAAITASETADNDTDDTNEIQTITSPDASVTVTPNGNNYELTVAGGGTDDQNIQGSGLAGETLTIGIEGGNPQDVSLADFALDTDVVALIAASDAADNDTSATNEIQPLTSTDGSVTVAANGIGFDLSVTGGGTDDQNIQGSGLAGETLTIGIEGGNPQDVSLADFALDSDVVALIAASDAADGDNSDTNEIQTITSPDASVTVTPVGNNYELTVAGGGSDDQNIQGSGLVGETLTIGIEGGNPQDVSLADFALDSDVVALIAASDAADGDNSDTNEIQTITSPDASVTVTPVGNNYELTVAGGGTDDQNIQGSGLAGETLTIGIEGGNPQDVSLADFALDTDVVALIAASDAADNDTSATNEIQPLTSTDGSVTVAANGIGFDLSVAGGGTNLFNTDGLILSADRTHNLGGNNLNFDGAGLIGIGTNSPQAKFHVSGGQVRAATFSGGDGFAYGFSSDTNTGMYRAGADQIAFDVGGFEVFRLSESAANGLSILANGSLELTEQLLDENGNTGNIGDILTATATGTEWKEPSVVVMGKANGANSVSVNNATVGGGGGINTVTFSTPRPDNDYIIQLTVVGDNRIYVTSQTPTGFTVEIKANTGNSFVVTEWFFSVMDF